MPNDIELRFNLGAAYERLGQFEDSEKEFKWILDKDPGNALALNYLGYMYADRGVHLKEARELIEKALAIEPDNGAFLDSHAWVLYKMGKYDEALVQMQKALKTEQKDPILFDHVGDIYSALNNPAMAKENWSRALELDPNNETIRAKLNSR
jgi:Tfp pilus assembly protein PilF